MAEPDRAAVVLTSGGLDSTTLLALADAEGRRIHALSFRYGQRHAVELQCAARQAERFAVVAHETVDLAHLGRLLAPATSLVASSALDVPKHGAPSSDTAIPSTYVPARNLLFLSYGLAWAEALGADELWIGVNALDYSGYPDCRPQFIAAFATVAALATRRGVEGEAIAIRSPLAALRKHEIIALGLRHGVDYADTVSCYDPVVDGERVLACGACESCGLRREGFALAGASDPTRYVT
ncbi:MAG: 7-cyano-7-deazaguanine synthase QueC [Deltaproteobacteria bacterium]|nr:7-cyano-7-deazaguanine synthase QueC [Deltaproteobacteria bacterium]